MNQLLKSLCLYLTMMLLLAGSSGCSKQSRLNRILERANQDFLAEHLDSAEIEYLNVLRLAPQNSLALGRLGLIYFQQGRMLRAHECLRQALELDPENSDLRSKLGATYRYARQNRQAEQEALRALMKQPGLEEALLVFVDSATNGIPELLEKIQQMRQKDKDRPSYHVAIAGLFLRQNGSTNAEIELKKALALDPKCAAAHALLGQLYSARADLADADKSLRTAADLSPCRSLRRLNYANFKFMTGSPTEARKLLESITQQAPDYLPGWYFLAKLAYEERRYPEAAGHIQRILSREPLYFDAVLLDARLKLDQAQPGQAIAEIERLPKGFASLPEVQYMLAVAWQDSGDSAKAVSCLNQALAADPNYSDAILRLAQISISKGDAAQVIPTLTQLIKQHPTIEEAHFRLAEAHLAQKAPEQALRVYHRMLDLFPKDPQVPYFIAAILASQKKPAEARQALDKALERDPDFLLAFEALIDLDIGEKQYQAALDRVNLAIAKHPSSAPLRLLLAKVYHEQKDLDRAEAAVLKAIELDPGFGTSYRLLGRLYVAKKNPQLALAKLTAFLSRSNDVQVLTDIGTIQFQELKNFPAARDAYEKALEINPRSVPVLNTLAYLYAEHFGQFDKALGLAEKAHALFPNDAGTADTYGWVLARKPQPDYIKALPLLEQAAAVLTDQPEVLYHLGRVRYALGLETPARLAFEAALAPKLDFPGKDDAQLRKTILELDPTNAVASAKALLERTIQTDPNDPVADIRLASIYDREGAADKAAKAYQQSLKQNPRNATILLRLSRLYAGPLNNPSKSLDYAKDAHSSAPDDGFVSSWLGHLVLQTGDYKWAFSLLQEAVRKLGDKSDLLFDMAWACYGLGRVSDAQRNMEQALKAGLAEEQTTSAKRFLTMTAAYNNPALRPELISDLDQVLKADPNYLPGLVLSAALAQAQGRFQDAKANLERVLVRDPLFSPAARDYALLCFQQFPDEPKLYDVALRARQDFTENADLAKVLGILSYRREDFLRAGQLLKDASQKLSSDAETLYYLGMTYSRLNQLRESRAALLQALTLNLNEKLAQQAKHTLAELDKSASK